MEFKDYHAITDSKGTKKWAKEKEGILIGDLELKCLICGKPTKYIDIYSEGRFCSDECLEEFYSNL